MGISLAQTTNGRFAALLSGPPLAGFGRLLPDAVPKNSRSAFPPAAPCGTAGIDPEPTVPSVRYRIAQRPGLVDPHFSACVVQAHYMLVEKIVAEPLF